METIYQSLVAVEPLTLIATICNLFIPMLIIKKFFLNKILAVLDQRRQAADKEITDAEQAKQEAMDIKKTYEANMLQANAKANEILTSAQKTAAERSEKIIGEAQQAAAQIKSKASADIAQERRRPSTTPRTKSPAWPWPLPERSWRRSWPRRIRQVSSTASSTNWVIRYDPGRKRLRRGSV